MSLESGRKSATEMRQAQKDMISMAASVQPTVAVTEKNWAAMIDSQKAQVDTLGKILEKLGTLTTEAQLVEYMERQLQILREDARGIWERDLAGAGTDEEYFEEAVLDFHDPQPDLGGLGTDAAYLAAGLTSIIDEDALVEDCTTKHFRPERKKRHGQTMGGM